jgi:alkanesulfonate monooxygenase SsuD/methylene tetrahydromethanopterin reductase-like flavin-dependent oxidoreductase (luciferase family)
MLRGEQPTVDGTWYHVHGAINSPAPVNPIPVMIGGGGERKTLRLVAQYADESNILCAPADIPRKLDALAEHCARLGRDRSEITVSYLTSICVAPTHEQAEAEADAYLARRNIDQAARRRVGAMVGSPDEIAEQCAKLLAHGIDGLTVNAPANGHIEGRVALIGETLAPLIASAGSPAH